VFSLQYPIRKHKELNWHFKNEGKGKKMGGNNKQLDFNKQLFEVKRH